ncbi:MAG: NAD(P)-dependent alcohol dehydrogenase [Anaerolineae bacterium]|nr:NAD(P)-dependent alcohol dehydrogenase [Anaerolineae bacterium]
MEAVVLERQKELTIRDIQLDEPLGPHDVRVTLRTVGVCGSDVHYYEWGSIGPYVVREPMVLGHEASGKVIEVGSDVEQLRVGDRVCMEPGIPDPNSRATRLGLYNLDPAVRFWATPPVHGVLRPTVVHPAAFTFKLPDNVSYEEGAMVEPLAVGMHGANKARIRPGDVAVVTGAGTIGMLQALAALAGGCSQVIMSDVVQPKLDLAATLGPITPVNVAKDSLTEVVMDLTDGWGADIVFECSGNQKAAESVFEPLCPGGCVVLVGIPGQPFGFDVTKSQAKEARVESVFRYAHVYPRAIALIASGQLNVRPLITDTFSFAESVQAFEYAAHMPPTSVKVQIEVAKD